MYARMVGRVPALTSASRARVRPESLRSGSGLTHVRPEFTSDPNYNSAVSHDHFRRHPARPVRNRRLDRRGRHGGGLQSARHAAGSHGRDKSLAVAPLRQRRESSAVRAGSEDHLVAFPPPYLRPLRRRQPGRRRVPRHGVSRGRDPVRPAREGSARFRPGPPLRLRDRGRARQGPPTRDRPPGSQTRERDADEVGAEAPRLRTGQGDRAGRPIRRFPHHASDADRQGPHGGGNDPRHLPVHGPRTARGAGSRRPHGHLRLRRSAVRDGDGKEGVLGKEPGVAHLVDHDDRSNAGFERHAGGAAGIRPRDPNVPGQGSRRPVADRSRRRGAAPVDPGRWVRRRRRTGYRHATIPRDASPSVDPGGPRDSGIDRATRP